MFYYPGLTDVTAVQEPARPIPVPLLQPLVDGYKQITASMLRPENIHRYLVAHLESPNHLLVQALDILRGHNALGFEAQVHDDLTLVDLDDSPLPILTASRLAVIVVLQQFLKCGPCPLSGQL